VRKFIVTHIIAVLMVSINFQSIVWLGYSINIEEITAKFCENKDKPELRCNGKCHINKVLSVANPEKQTRKPATDLLSKLQLNLGVFKKDEGFVVPSEKQLPKTVFKDPNTWLVNNDLAVIPHPPELG
jgi:hypothetical protein